jgi:hypothetical protein
MCLLAFFCLVQLILSILKIVFFDGIGTSDAFVNLIKAMMEQGEITENLDTFQTLFTQLGYLFGGISLASCCMGVCTLCCGYKMNHLCKGWFTKCGVLWSFLLFVINAIFWLIIGSAFILPYGLGPKFIEDQCKYAKENDAAKQKIDFPMGLEIPTQDTFSMINEVDSMVNDNVMKFMCSDFCICPGKMSDDWVTEYAMSDELQNYGRVFDPLIKGELKPDRQFPSDKSPIIFDQDFAYPFASKNF